MMMMIQIPVVAFSRFQEILWILLRIRRSYENLIVFVIFSVIVQSIGGFVVPIHSSRTIDGRFDRYPQHMKRHQNQPSTHPSLIKAPVRALCYKPRLVAQYVQSNSEIHISTEISEENQSSAVIDNRSTSTTTSSSHSSDGNNSDIVPDDNQLFYGQPPPYIAIITEPSACDNDERMKATLAILQKCLQTNYINLLSIRITKQQNIAAEQKQRILSMITTLVQWRQTDPTVSKTFRIVVSSDWFDNDILQSGIDGIHFKESHRSIIPLARKMHNDIQSYKQKQQQQLFPDGEQKQQYQPQLFVGTSTHTIESAIEAWKMYDPIDYYIAGTCFVTESHPEKASPDDCEGPEFPGQVKLALYNYLMSSNRSSYGTNDKTHSKTATTVPPVLAIGGIDSTNCHQPLERIYHPLSTEQESVDDKNNNDSSRSMGADGIATIRAILPKKGQDESDPKVILEELYTKMKSVL